MLQGQSLRGTQGIREIEMGTERVQLACASTQSGYNSQTLPVNVVHIQNSILILLVSSQDKTH